MSKRYAALFTGGKQEVAPPPVRTDYRLLLVDDDANVLAALRRVFRGENYELLFASSAEEALRILESTPVQLIISDHMMPGMSGSELLQKVRSRWPDTIRIMLTGHADTEAVMGSVKGGAVYRFILKPWNDDDLRLSTALALEQNDLLQKNRALERENRKQQTELESMARRGGTSRSQLAILLHKKGLLTTQQVQQLHREVQVGRVSVMQQLVQNGWVDGQKVYQLLRQELMLEEIDLREYRLDPALLHLVPQSTCTRQMVLPLRVADKRLRLAMVDPLDMGLIEEISFATGYSIHPLLCELGQMQAKLTELFGELSQAAEELSQLTGSGDPFESIEIILDDDGATGNLEQLLGGAEEPSAVRLVNAIILEALRLGASDIHIHPRTRHVVVRYRIDGVLLDKIQIPSTLLPALVSRIKVMSELDITERRRPQDGRITVKAPMRIVDLRISTLPTINGEKIVMRVLERQSAAQSLEGLGLSGNNFKRLLHVVNKPQGIILATGPTGSGKTTTLFALLQHEASSTKNYVTIEDPVEFHVDLAGQVPVRERIGLSFASILRAILRQDPDVILLGEIRDQETAEVAFHAALTGHLVFSTLHTNSAAATIARLFDLGLKPYILASALEAIIAQRLVRRICPHCREKVVPAPELLKSLGRHFLEPGLEFFQGRGCQHCHDGYKGRIGIHEVLTMNDVLRSAISAGMSAYQLQAIAREHGMTALIDDACEKVQQGMTTVEEVLRVLGPQDYSE
ncbi:MAG: response regulator [Moraxellaceae bacterium]|jgi:type II secretory ATPase GspE/PulE/Tfp pilus assembly ATPase PilB-like protein/DNA-binding response OmpR family regulator|nr:response regulator [Moraxellaceae bacterium]